MIDGSEWLMMELVSSGWWLYHQAVLRFQPNFGAAEWDG